VICSKIVFILHRFRNIITFTVSITACDLTQSLLFDTACNTVRFVCERILAS